MACDPYWKSIKYRLSVIAEIEEIIKQCGLTLTPDGTELEKYIFTMAATRHEYFYNIAKLKAHLKELSHLNKTTQLVRKNLKLDLDDVLADV